MGHDVGGGVTDALHRVPTGDRVREPGLGESSGFGGEGGNGGQGGIGGTAGGPMAEPAAGPYPAASDIDGGGAAVAPAT